MSKIKKFFSKKKEEAAFKLKLGGGLGQGRTLNAQSFEASTSLSKPTSDVALKRKELSDEVRAAATAALGRIKDPKEFNTSLAAVKAQAKKELEAERKLKEIQSSELTYEDNPSANLACQGVFFRCPFISNEILSKKEWKIKIRNFLYQQLETEKALTSCLIIYNCNNKEKAEGCIATLTKYLENIVQHPDEEKYCKIRMSNRIFSEKIRCVEGALDFLQAAGFREVDLDNEPFLIWSEDNIEKDYDMAALLEALQNAEPIQLVLDRNIKVLLPSQAKRVILPDDFYRMSIKEIKREQQLRVQANEIDKNFKTKAMREREEQRNFQMYKYALVRIKFPNGLYIQGTFNVYEKIKDIFEFVQSCLQDGSLQFDLTGSSEGKFTEEDMEKTIYDLRLIPNIVLFFNVSNETVVPGQDINFLKEELLLLVQSI